MASVKVFAKNKRTNGQAQNYMPPIYRCGGIKKTLKCNYLGYISVMKMCVWFKKLRCRCWQLTLYQPKKKTFDGHEKKALENFVKKKKKKK